MKRLAIDARLYSQTGVGTYLRNLIQFLPTYLNDEIEVTIILHSQDEHLIKTIPFSQTKVVSVPWHSFAEQTTFYKYLNAENYNLVHFPYFGYPVLYKKPFVATVHDLTPLLFETGKASTKNPFLYKIKHFIFSQVLRSQITNAITIITPTQTVKEQILSYYPSIQQDKIAVTYEGVDANLLSEKADMSTANSVLNDVKVNGSGFFLYVGNFYPHKNVEMLLAAWKSLPKEYTLVCAGPDDFFTQKMKNIVTAEGLEENVYFKTGLERAQLKGLYQSALALIHPSLSEGFGLPLVEAMHFQLPIIASDIPVFRELVQDSFTPFTPQSSSSCVDSILKYSPYKRQQVSYDSLLKPFSFEKMAMKTAQIYQNALSRV
jgi:glycosyltransferase involved in cell wall biosynthesis